MPLAECRFPGPAARRIGRLRRESERSTPNGRAKTFGGGGGGAHTNSELPQAGFPESGEVYNVLSRLLRSFRFHLGSLALRSIPPRMHFSFTPNPKALPGCGTRPL